MGCSGVVELHLGHAGLLEGYSPATAQCGDERAEVWLVADEHHGVRVLVRADKWRQLGEVATRLQGGLDHDFVLHPEDLPDDGRRLNGTRVRAGEDNVGLDPQLRQPLGHQPDLPVAMPRERSLGVVAGPGRAKPGLAVTNEKDSQWSWPAAVRRPGIVWRGFGFPPGHGHVFVDFIFRP